MSPRLEPKRREFLLALLGAAGAVLIAAICFGGGWLWQHAGTAPSDAVHAMTRPGPDSILFGWIATVAAVAGFAIVGKRVHSPIATRLGNTIHNLIMVCVGTCVGASAGLLAYVVFAFGSGAQETLSGAVRFLPAALGDPLDPARAFLLGGALCGFTVTVYLRGGTFVRTFARNGTGALIGGIAGLVLYAIAYVLLRYPHLPASADYLFHLAEAIYAASVVEFGLVLLGAVVGVMTSRYSWRLYGIFTLTALLSVVMGYILYTITATLPRVPPGTAWLSYVLFAAEVVSLTMVVLYSFYTIDVATRKRWARDPKNARFSKYYLPRVVLQVPTYNEPPEIVIASLQSLLELDYPEDRYLIMVADDSTKPERADPVREFCQKHRIHYFHRDDRAGFKAGALNYLLPHTPEDVDLIAVVDADYQVESDFLYETVGYFIDPELAWVQTPQDYRNEGQSFLTKHYYLADKYFYRTVLPSRNEENSIIFCGTMGILRKEALVDVGGWAPKYITEDAELSVRLLNGGWKSQYVNKSYGRGLIPATFGAYRKQHRRWAFGGGQVLRGHFLDIFFGRFTMRQRFDYLVGNMHWFEGLFIFIIASVVLLMGWSELLGTDIATHHSREIMLIGLVPLFLLVDGFTRLHMVLRRSLNVTFGGTLRVLGMWFAVKFSNSVAATKGFLGVRMPFQRTRKNEDGRLNPMQALPEAIRTTPVESLMAALSILTGLIILGQTVVGAEPAHGTVLLTRLFLGFWLLYYSFIFGSAPLYAYKAFTTFSSETGKPNLSVKLRSVAQ